MEIVISVVAKVVEYTVGPILHQLGYIVFYKRNINNREKQLQNLVGVRERVKNMVDEANIQNYVIFEDVSNWLANVDKFIESSDKFEMSTQCFNLFQRHNLGRKAKKMSEEIFEIIQDGKMFDKVGYAKPFQGSDSSNIEGYQSLESRMSTAKNIKDTLADSNVNKVGVYGMGGVGKTMLVEEVKRLVKEHKLFDQVITVTIGQTFTVKGIQGQIESMLRLDFKRDESEEGRAILLRNKLEKENKILIVLDDIWKELNLDAIGIPCEFEGIKGCKILITGRDQHVVKNEMNAQKSFEVDPLSKEESWEFFKNTIGDFDKTSIEPTAKKVAKECAGLPIALATVGKALKGKTLNIWKDALKQLKNPIAVNIKGVSDKVYSSIKMSYDFIQSEEAKLIFRLCSVFPDDYEIDLECLSMYAMGMKLLNDVNTWDEARNRTMKLVDDLKSASLLLESEDNNVKMHDVIRDVAIYISTKEGRMSTLSHGYKWSEWQEKDRYGHFRAIFVNCEDFDNLPQNLKFPELELLIFFTESVKEMKLQISDTFFAGMENLKVLDLTEIYFLQSTMSITHSLANLRMLHISWCAIEDIEKICDLKELEILGIEYCPIRELPETMSQLKKLKKLQVSNCDSLSVIPPNVISSMMKLEELNLLGFMEWGKEVLYRDKLILNSKLSELKCLVNLTCLKLTIPDENIFFDAFSDNWNCERFIILVGSDCEHSEYSKFLRYLDLKIKPEIVLNDVVNKIQLEKCDGLSLKTSVGVTHILFQPNGNGYPYLRHLSLSESLDMRHLIGDQLGNHCPNYFSALDSLVLNGMESLGTIVQMQVRENPFKKLRFIDLRSCNQLRNLFAFSIYKGLSNLEWIDIRNCTMMDEIVCMESEEPTIKIEGSNRLSFLRLSKVDRLTSFCSKQLTHQHSENNLIPFFDDQVAFPQLEYLEINEASNLQRIWKNNGLTANSFCKLRTIKIVKCKNLRFIFAPNTTTTLVSLEVLEIVECELLEGIFEKEEASVKEKDVLLKLRSICVSGCPQLKSLFLTSIKCLQQLEYLSIDASFELFSEDNASSSFEILFPNLRSLSMRCNAMKRDCWFTKFSRSELLPNLKELCFNGSENDHDNSIVWPLGSCQLLFSVEKLEIKKCNSFIEVLFPDEGINHNGRHANLKKLILDSLPNLRHIWKDKLKFLFSNLKVVSVSNCDGLKSLLSSMVAKSLVQLEKLSVRNCRKMISIIGEEEGDGDEENDEIIFGKLAELELIYLPTLASLHLGKCKLMFPCLERLEIRQCPEMKIFSVGTTQILFPKLRKLSVPCNAMKTDCWLTQFLRSELIPNFKVLCFNGPNEHDNKITLSLGSYQLLYNVEKLEIEICDSLIEILFSDEGNNHNGRCANLKELRLSLLPSLTHLLKDNTETITLFNSLEVLDVKQCNKLKSLFPSTTTSFYNLKVVSVGMCGGMKNLMSWRVAKNLVELEKLTVTRCNEMISIIGEEERDGDDEENDEIIFSKLVQLKLASLDTLASFQIGKCKLVFPCLETLKIDRCPKMKIFSNGIIKASQLEHHPLLHGSLSALL